jgi:hypothetical protein
MDYKPLNEKQMKLPISLQLQILLDATKSSLEIISEPKDDIMMGHRLKGVLNHVLKRIKEISDQSLESEINSEVDKILK